MSKGFTLVEVLLAVTLLAVFVLGLTQLLSFSVLTVKQGENFTKGNALAQEQLEALINLKNIGGPQWDWINTPVNTNPNEYYQPIYSGGSWQLGAKTTTPDLSVPQVKLIEIKPVKRCGFDLCTDVWGILDPHSRLITVTVKWLERGLDQQVVLSTVVNHI